MSTITLFAAPIAPSGPNPAESPSTSLVPSGRIAFASRKENRNDAAYPDDSYIWTASAGSDGTFTFYALPQRKPSNYRAFNQSDSNASYARWNTEALRHAAAQYALSANLPPIHGSGYATGTMLNVYA